MIHELMLVKLDAKENDKLRIVEDLMVETRIKLLKIPGVMNLQCGKSVVDTQNPHDFFVSMHFDNLAKKELARKNSLFVHYYESILKPVSSEIFHLLFEMDPGKNTRYS